MKYLKLFICLGLLLLLTSCTKQEYEVKFLGLNDEVIDVLIVTEEDKVIYPAAPKVEGHTFIKWDQTVDYVTNNVTIKALYEIHMFEVIFFDNEGQIIEKQTVNYGDSPNPPKAPTIENYDFIGWDQDLTNVTKDLDVTALYKKNAYMVTFVDMYGEIIEVQMVKPGDSANPPKAPTVDYYTFDDWDQDYKEINDDLTIKAQYIANNEKYQKENVNYWLQILASKYNIDKELFTQEEIDNYNQIITNSYSKTKVVDVKTLNQTLTKDEVKKLIESYANISRYTVYHHESKKQLSNDEITTILNNRAIDQIPDRVDVQFGIITDFSLMRSYPTMHYSNDYDRDRFQETSLNVGEAVAIYHTSGDGNWYFVQAENYNGWIMKNTVGLCSYEVMNEFLTAKERIVVISDYVVLKGAFVRMGQSFPKIGENTESYDINFPTRDNNGNLKLEKLSINRGKDYSDGYLKYTYENIFKQAFKLLGIDYSWGDKEKTGRDCSSTQNAVYKTFGFMMPRNTSNQLSIPSYGKTVNGVSSNHMKKNYAPGTLIFSSGHVMMYIGEDADGLSYLFHNTSAGDGKCILQPLDEYGGTRIIATLKLQ
ncbi:MAG: SH3 domain-containing protein [Bacilli bacterium]|nr:SH3 domain-containing protein [Bacilli bacterium]